MKVRPDWLSRQQRDYDISVDQASP